MMTDIAFAIDPTNEIVAIMPGCAATVGNSDHCTIYVHIGQHGAGDIALMRGDYEQADPCNYDGLLAELGRIGYDVNVIPLHSIDSADYQAERVAELARV